MARISNYDGPLPWTDRNAYFDAQAAYVRSVLDRLRGLGFTDNDFELQKLKTLGELELILGPEARARDTLVHVSGGFVFPHVGHGDLLSQAKNYGRDLVVSLDSEESVRRGGRSTKMKLDYERAGWLSHHAAVDYVTFFIGDDGKEVVNVLRPDVFVKSDEYENPKEKVWKPVAERSMVEEYGGRVQLVPRRYPISSTELAQRVWTNDIRSPMNGGDGGK